METPKHFFKARGDLVDYPGWFEEITDKNTLTQERINEGDRVRVIKSGVVGVVKGFGSVPGVPKLINVAYDGGAGAITCLRNSKKCRVSS